MSFLRFHSKLSSRLNTLFLRNLSSPECSFQTSGLKLGVASAYAAAAVVLALSSVSCGPQPAAPQQISQLDVINHQESVSLSPTAYLTTSTVFIRTPGGEQCTGSIVSQTRIVTAQHCTVDGLNAEAYSIEFGTDISNMSVKMHGKGQVRQHPLSDMATLDLGGPLPSGFIPVPLLPENTLKQGDKVVVGGFGVTTPSPRGGYQMPRYLRWGYMIFNSWEPELTLTSRTGSPLTYRSVLEFLPDSRGSVVCSGDSGGPVYAQFNGAWGLVGINSASDCATRSSSSDARANASWILAQ